MITINKSSLQEATEVEIRAIETAMAGVNRTRDTAEGPQPLQNPGEYLEYYINEVLMPTLITQEPASSEKIKDIMEKLHNASDEKRDAILAELEK